MPLTTKHSIYYRDSRDNFPLPDNSVDLIITSPPYPMIEMWDTLFNTLIYNPDKLEAPNSPIPEDIDGNELFEMMHVELDKVWRHSYRVLKEGGFICLNIGDTVRTFNNKFQLFPNHARVMSACMNIGFDPLPLILWRKQTNAPNKFMGSGMLPAGAYVTMENEFILIFRKGKKRTFTTSQDKLKRQQSAFFWEERNKWFSDVWDFKGIRQDLVYKDISRSAAFPFELPYRLINMYSLKGDTILDPFLGTSTTTLAAMGSCRNSAGIEFNETFKDIIRGTITSNKYFLNRYIDNRLTMHNAFVITHGPNNFKYINNRYSCLVKTKPETEISFDRIDTIIEDKTCTDKVTLFDVIYKG